MKLINVNGKYAVGHFKYAKVDDDLYSKVNIHSWYLDKVCVVNGVPRFYIRSRINNKKVSLHQFVMNYPKSKIDHINHDIMDNQIKNLRIATNSQNQMNKTSIIGSSKYKGVSWNKEKSKWECYIGFNGKRLRLGYFINEVDAAIAYNDKCLIYHGDFACLNKLPQEITRHK